MTLLDIFLYCCGFACGGYVVFLSSLPDGKLVNIAGALAFAGMIGVILCGIADMVHSFL
jgi:hypothetical protein